jgi:benzoyl-CoA reductase/2-hydroxyglutaryl-CoA dehydratase subunit BcrC/BadD/HgdB
MAEVMITERQGLYERVYALFGIVGKLREDMSEEETEGILRVLPSDTYKALKSILRHDIMHASFAFMSMVRTWLEEAVQAREEGKKIVLVPFNFPPEIIHAFDNAFPLTSEVLSTLGVVTLEGQGERYWDYAMGLGLPDHICSSNTIELGSMLTGMDFEPDAIVSSAPGSCDVNSKIHEFVAHYLGIPHIILAKPMEDGRRGHELFNKYFRRMVGELEELTGEKLKEENLRRVVEKANRATELFYDLWELKKQSPCPVPGIFALYTYASRFAMWGRDEAIETLQACIDVARRNHEEGTSPVREEVARPLWIYLPYFFDFEGFFEWMEERGISHMGDALLCFMPARIDTTSMDSMLTGLAGEAMKMPMTHQMGGASMSQCWLDDVCMVIKDLNCDSAIYCGHHSCKQTWSVFSIVRTEIMKRTGVPTLCLQGDSWMKRTTPMSVLQEEISAFVDNVLVGGGRKRRRHGARAKAASGVTADTTMDTE